MVDAAPDRPRLAPESVAVLAEAVGIPIAPERLPDVTAVLAELFALDTLLADVDVTGIDPATDDVDWPEIGS
jgi:hypothetical protein